MGHFFGTPCISDHGNTEEEITLESFIGKMNSQNSREWDLKESYESLSRMGCGADLPVFIYQARYEP